MPRSNTSLEVRRDAGPSLGEQAAVNAHLQCDVLHRSASVALYDVRCSVTDGARSPEEWCENHQLVFPRAGMFVRHVRGQEVLADPNHVLFFQPQEVYQVSHPTCCGDACTVLVFDEELLMEAVQRYQPRVQERAQRAFPSTHTASDPKLFLFHERLRQAASEVAVGHAPERLAIDEAALEVLDAVLLRTYRAAPQQALRGMRTGTLELHHDQVERTKRVLAARFADALAIEDIAQAVHCSAFHLSRLFRQATGLSLHQYRQRLRLHHGVAALVSGERDLAQLALSLGFSSHSHFSDTFQRAFGATPSSFRRVLAARDLRQLSKNLKVEGGPAL